MDIRTLRETCKRKARAGPRPVQVTSGVSGITLPDGLFDPVFRAIWYISETIETSTLFGASA